MYRIINLSYFGSGPRGPRRAGQALQGLARGGGGLPGRDKTWAPNGIYHEKRVAFKHCCTTALHCISFFARRNHHHGTMCELLWTKWARARFGLRLPGQGPHSRARVHSEPQSGPSIGTKGQVVVRMLISGKMEGNGSQLLCFDKMSIDFRMSQHESAQIKVYPSVRIRPNPPVRPNPAELRFGTAVRIRPNSDWGRPPESGRKAIF